jgi:hypothetical protein
MNTNSVEELINQKVNKYMIYSIEFTKLLNTIPQCEELYHLNDIIHYIEVFIQKSNDMNNINEEKRKLCITPMDFYNLDINIPYNYLLLTHNECKFIANKFGLNDSEPIEKLWHLAVMNLFDNNSSKLIVDDTLRILTNLNEYDTANYSV